MKKFQYQYTKTIKICIFVALALCVGGFALNTWRLFSFGAQSFYATLQYFLIFAVSIGAPVLLISMLVSSYYEVTKQEIITRFGIVKSKFKLSDVKKLIYVTDKNKLFVYFTDGTYMNIVVNANWINEFIGCVLEQKKNIEVEYTAGEVDE